MAKRKRRKRRARKSPPQTWGWEWQVLSEMTGDPADVEPRDDAPSPPPPEWWMSLEPEGESEGCRNEKDEKTGDGGSRDYCGSLPPQSRQSPPSEPQQRAGSGKTLPAPSPRSPQPWLQSVNGWSVPELPPSGLPLQSLKSTDVCAFNASAERRFVETLLTWLEQAGELERSFVRRNMAFSLDVSPRTIDRYIEKYCAELSPWFELVNGTIRRKG